MRHQETVIGVLHLIAGTFVFSLVTLLWVLASKLSSVFRGSFIPGLVAMFGKPVALALIVIALLDIIAAVGYLRHHGWARPLLIGVSVLELPIFPIGTAVGGYTLLTLLK